MWSSRGTNQATVEKEGGRGWSGGEGRRIIRAVSTLLFISLFRGDFGGATTPIPRTTRPRGRKQAPEPEFHSTVQYSKQQQQCTLIRAGKRAGSKKNTQNQRSAVLLRLKSQGGQNRKPDRAPLRKGHGMPRLSPAFWQFTVVFRLSRSRSRSRRKRKRKTACWGCDVIPPPHGWRARPWTTARK